ncbi:hypothetical protein LCGC14_1176930 [marine sediment metagenome]|uniref:Uncharacterized protein n=1 Tax=marine sediment metagenome TaxID=412755 RepID=A0A0F9PTL7_9ZZZZ
MSLKPFNEKKTRYKLRKQHWNQQEIDKYVKYIKDKIEREK